MTRSSKTPLTATALNTFEGSGSIKLGRDTPKTTKKERKKAKKATKALTRDKVVTTADIQSVARALHPEKETADLEMDDRELDELTEDLEIKLNLKYNKSTCNTKSARKDFITEEPGLDLERTTSETERLLKVFQVNGRAVGKEGDLVGELVAAIKKDLTHHHDELQIIARNKASFWRWANKRAYRGFVENGKDWDSKEPTKTRNDSLGDDRRASEATAEGDTEDESEVLRSGSINSSEADSAGTGLTVPSSKASTRQKSLPLTLEDSPPSSQVGTDPGWTHVGKRLLAHPPGKLKLASNGGLHYLDQKPKGKFGAFAWSGSKHTFD
jgi:hypothetical protein